MIYLIINRYHHIQDQVQAPVLSKAHIQSEQHYQTAQAADHDLFPALDGHRSSQECSKWK